MNSTLTKIFIDEIHSTPAKKNYPTNKTVYNHIDEIWSIDLAEMIDYKISNNKGFRFIFVIIDKFIKKLRTIPIKNQYSETITDEFSNILSTPKRSPLKLESDRGKEWYNSIFRNFLKRKIIQNYSRFTDKIRSIAERVMGSIRNLLKKPVLEKGNANWISEFPSVNKQLKNTIHSSVKMTPIQARKNQMKKKSIPLFKIEELEKNRNIN